MANKECPPASFKLTPGVEISANIALRVIREFVADEQVNRVISEHRSRVTEQHQGCEAWEETQDLKISDPLPFKLPPGMKPLHGVIGTRPYPHFHTPPRAIPLEVDPAHFLPPLHKRVPELESEPVETGTDAVGEASTSATTNSNPLLDYTSIESIVHRLLSPRRPVNPPVVAGVHLSFMTHCIKPLLRIHVEFNPQISRIVLHRNSALRERGRELGIPGHYMDWLCGDNGCTGETCHVNLREIDCIRKKLEERFERKGS